MNLKKMPNVLAALALVLTLVITGCKSEPDDPEQYTVTFNALGGTVEGSTVPVEIKVESGKTIAFADLPAPVKSIAPSIFWGWFTSDGSGGGSWGNIFNENSKVTKNISVYAQWGATAKPAEFTVTFNAAGGSPATTTQTVFDGATCEPPVTTRSSYTFSGWYTGQNGGGTLFTNTTSVTANITVYAHWQRADATSLGETLILQGPVYQEVERSSSGTISYETYKDTLISAIWKITDGTLYAEFLGEDEHLEDMGSSSFYNYYNDYFDNLSVSDSTVKIAVRDEFWGEVDGSDYYITRENLTAPVVNESQKTFSYTDERVMYVYVDKDVTASGKGKNIPGSGDISELMTGGYEPPVTTKDFTIEYKKGWNAVYTKTITSGSYTGTASAPTPTSMNATITIELKNPANLRWVLEIDD